MTRREDLARAIDRLAVDGGLCVFGPPGVGKGAFVRHVLSDVAEVVVVNARGSRSIAELRRTIAASVGVAWSGEDPRELYAALGHASLGVLWLEDVDEVAPKVAEEVAVMFGEVDSVQLVTTSMHRLGSPFDFQLGPLPPGTARKLFVRGVERAMPGYSPDAAEVEAIDDLLAALDRLPLAIELAASRRPLLSPQDILDRLDARFELLRERQGRALETAVGWAWELLEDELQQVLLRLSVFEAPFTLSAAETLLDQGAAATLDVVEELRDRSLLTVAAPSTMGVSRFALYETVRSYARATGEPPTAVHAAYFLRTTTDALGRLDEGGGAVGRLTEVVPELYAVLQRDGEDAAPAALLLDRVFARTGTDVVRTHALQVALAKTRDDEARARLLIARAMKDVDAGALESAARDLRVALDAARAGPSPRLEAVALFRAGDVARRRGEVGDALFLLAQALDLAPDAQLDRLTRAHLGCCQVDHGMYDEARETVARVERSAEAASLVVECEVRRRLAYVHFYLGNHAEQHRQGVVALDAAHRAQHARLQALCEQGLGDSATVLGELDEARTAYEHALKMHRRLGDTHYEGVLLGNLGTVHHRQGRLDAAAQCYREALATHRRTGARPYEAVVAMSLGLLEAERGRVDEAGHHLGLSATVSEELGLHDDVGAARLGRGWALVRAGKLDAAREHFSDAAVAFERGEAPAWQAIAAYLAGDERHSVARSIVEQHGGATELALLCAAERWLGAGDDPGPEVRSLHVRVAAAAVAFCGAAPARPPPAPVRLEIAADGSWFDAGEGRVDLQRRRAHRLILLELVARVEGGEPLDVYDAFDVGWPNEQAGAEAAADRVYWVVGTLRRLGLKDVLITADAGYLLAPGVETSVRG